MNISLGTLGDRMEGTALVQRLRRVMRDIELSFSRIPDNVRLVYEKTLNFAAPGAVPGITEQTVTVEGVELGDTVVVGSPVAVPAGFLPPLGYVSAAGTLKVVWIQVSGAPADPDGAGGLYRFNIWRH